MVWQTVLPSHSPFDFAGAPQHEECALDAGGAVHPGRRSTPSPFVVASPIQKSTTSEAGVVEDAESQEYESERHT